MGLSSNNLNWRLWLVFNIIPIIKKKNQGSFLTSLKRRKFSFDFVVVVFLLFIYVRNLKLVGTSGK